MAHNSNNGSSMVALVVGIGIAALGWVILSGRSAAQSGMSGMGFMAPGAAGPSTKKLDGTNGGPTQEKNGSGQPRSSNKQSTGPQINYSSQNKANDVLGKIEGGIEADPRRANQGTSEPAGGDSDKTVSVNTPSGPQQITRTEKNIFSGF